MGQARLNLSYIVLIFLIPFQAWCASFDCGKASKKVEKMICSDTALSLLDEQLGEAYQEALASSPKPAIVKAEQKTWIHTERNLCQNAGCLQLTYRQRIFALNLGCIGADVGSQNSGSKARGDSCIAAIENADLSELAKWPREEFGEIFPLRINGMAGCHWILIGQDRLRPRMAMVSLIKQTLVVVAKGQFSAVDSAGNAGDDAFQEATTYKFPNGVSSIRLHTEGGRGGAGFSYGGKSSYYVRRVGSKLSVILSAFDEAGSVYAQPGNDGRDCSDLEMQIATLRFGSATTSGWPDAYLEVRSEASVECWSSPATNLGARPQIKHHKEKLRWDGAQYQYIRE